MLHRPPSFLRLLSPRTLRNRSAGKVGLYLELLERRDVPAAPVLQPTWISQGPILDSLDGNIKGIANNAAIGAIETVAPDPGNPDILYVGTVNGGIWKTTNATSGAPSWTPLTDSMPSLSIGALEFDPNDATDQTLWAGTGNYSSYFSLAAPFGGVGLYETTNGGQNWTQVGASTFAGLNIRSILPTTLQMPGSSGHTIFVATEEKNDSSTIDSSVGLYRSDDSGNTWSLVSGSAGLPAGKVTQVIVDPSNPDRFYVGIPRQGVYSLDYSQSATPNWTPTAALTGASTSVRVRLTAMSYTPTGSNAPQTVLYAALLGLKDGSAGTGEPTGIFQSVNGGLAWTSLDVPDVNPSGQGQLQFSFVAHPSNPNLVYVGGNTVAVAVAAGYIGNHAVIDAAQPSGSQITKLDDTATIPTSPHPDSRNMVFDATGTNLIEVDDGGIYMLSNPTGAAPVWTSLNGDLAVTEFLWIDYDSINHVVFGGVQDNGSPLQDGPGLLTYHDQVGGDGQTAAADNRSTPNQSTHYQSYPSLTSFQTETFDSTNTLLNTTYPDLKVLQFNSNGTPILESDGQQETKSLLKIGAGLQFVTPYALNAVTPTQLVIGGGNGGVYESFDGGNTLTTLSPSDVGNVSAVAYGGVLNGQDNSAVLYVGSYGDDQNHLLFLRSAAGAALTPLTAYPGLAPNHIVLDPNNWQAAYIIDVRNHIYVTTNAGASFTEITGNLQTYSQTPDTPVNGLAVFPNPSNPGDDVVFVNIPTLGVWATTNPTLGSSTQWVQFGTNLPNIAITQMLYDATDNVLVAGTLGRGVWTVPNLSNFVGDAAPVLDLNGPAPGEANVVTFTLGGGAVALAAQGATVTDSDSAQLVSARVQLANIRDAGAEILAATTTGTNIQASYSASTGILSLTGADTLANYQQVLASVTYNDTATNPTVADRVVSFQVNDGAANSTPVLATVQVVAGGAALQVDLNGSGGGTDATATFTEGGGETPLTPAADLMSGNSANLQSMHVTLAGGPQTGESLAVDTAGTALLAAYDAANGQLTISGSETVANYQKVLRTLRYLNTDHGIRAGTRDVLVVVNDGTADSGHYRVRIHLIPVNDSPTQTSHVPFAMTPIAVNEIDNEGDDLDSLVRRAIGADAFPDPDAHQLQAIAITAVDDTNGKWQYQTGEQGADADRTDVWEDMEAVSPANALVLTITEVTRIRFVPNASFHGTVVSGLTFRVWDITFPSGSPIGFEQEANRVIADQGGGSTGLSAQTGTVDISVQTHTELFVSSVYRDLLGRNPESIGLNYWSGIIDSAALSRTEAALTIENSLEHRNLVVDQLFSDLLHRQADPSGRAFFLSFLGAGHSADQMRAGILGSAEYFQARGESTTTGFVQAVYADLLGRSPEGSGLAVWDAVLQGGSSRESVANSILASSESRAHQVRGLYQQFLRRDADPAGVQQFSGELAAGVFYESVLAELLGSNEYFSRT